MGLFRSADRQREAVSAGSGRGGGEAALLDMIAEAQAHRYGYGDVTPWQLPTVVACRKLIADTCALSPPVAVRNGAAVPRQPVWLAKPDPFEPAWAPWHRAAHQLTGPAGHCWFRITSRDAAGYTTSVRVLDGDQVAPEFDTMGRLRWGWFDGVRLEVAGDYRGDLHWCPADLAERGTAGVSPLVAAWPAVEFLAALTEMIGSFWEAGFPSLALRVEGRLSKVQRDELRTEMRETHHRRHEPWIVDRNGQLEPIAATAVESQLVESIDAADRQIARALLVRPSLVNVAANDSLTYTTTAEEFHSWKILGLGAYLMRLAAVSAECLPYGMAVLFNTSDLDRQDPYTQAQTNALALAGQPWLTAPEVRADRPYALTSPSPNLPPPLNPLPQGRPMEAPT
jgi:hypothetical protein